MVISRQNRVIAAKIMPITRRFRGAEYRITVDNAAGVQHGVKAVTVDGKAICGNVLPLAAAGTEVTVQVTMG